MENKGKSKWQNTIWTSPIHSVERIWLFSTVIWTKYRMFSTIFNCMNLSLCQTIFTDLPPTPSSYTSFLSVSFKNDGCQTDNAFYRSAREFLKLIVKLIFLPQTFYEKPIQQWTSRKYTFGIILESWKSILIIWQYFPIIIKMCLVKGDNYAKLFSK